MEHFFRRSFALVWSTHYPYWVVVLVPTLQYKGCLKCSFAQKRMLPGLYITAALVAVQLIRMAMDELGDSVAASLPRSLYFPRVDLDFNLSGELWCEKSRWRRRETSSDLERTIILPWMPCPRRFYNYSSIPAVFSLHSMWIRARY